MSALGDSLTKFPHLSKSICERDFNQWASPNHYRTNYNDMTLAVCSNLYLDCSFQ